MTRKTGFMNKLYHMDLGFPYTFKYPENLTVNLEWGRHAKSQAEEDRYGLIHMVETLNTDDYYPVEVEYDLLNSQATKMLLRSKKAEQGLNLCVAVIPTGNNWFVKTVWYNKADDKHNTLDVDKYVVPAFPTKKTIDRTP